MQENVSLLKEKTQQADTRNTRNAKVEPMFPLGMCPSGEGGRLKIVCRKVHGFEPHRAHYFFLFFVFF